jgi:hypothetical protein
MAPMALMIKKMRGQGPAINTGHHAMPPFHIDKSIDHLVQERIRD